MMAATVPRPPLPRSKAAPAPVSASVSASLAAPAVAVPRPASSAQDGCRLRIWKIAVRLNNHCRRSSVRDPREFFHLCYALARGIDHSVTTNDIPPKTSVLAEIVKQAYKHRDEALHRSAIFVLMISVKNACRNSWFCAENSKKLLAMAKEISSSFCMDYGTTSESSNALQVICKVMTRFYPMMKLSRLISSFEVKRGYEILVSDINIPRDIMPGQKIYLFVAQTDNMETSSCIVSPPQVNFLINGEGVEKRSNISLENRPQLPTDVTKLLNYGMNLFQAIGCFNGDYTIAMVMLSINKSKDVSSLQDHVQSSIASDSEIIEGPSRISLSCPISFKRINVPVKGHQCKHYQCFDFDNFIELNSRVPHWRCPCCNHSVDCEDIRIDQNMVKILEKTRESVCHVIICSDGSWKVDNELDSVAAQEHSGVIVGQGDSNVPSQVNGNTNYSSIVDLSMEEDSEDDISLTTRQLTYMNGCTSWKGRNTCDKNGKLFDAQTATLYDQFLNSTSHGVTSTINGNSNSSFPPTLHSNENLCPVPQNTGVDVQPAGVSGFFPDAIITCDRPATFNQGNSYAPGFLYTRSSVQCSQAMQSLDDLQLQHSRFANTISCEAERPSMSGQFNAEPIPSQDLLSNHSVHGASICRSSTCGIYSTTIAGNSPTYLCSQMQPTPFALPDGDSLVSNNMEMQQFLMSSGTGSNIQPQMTQSISSQAFQQLFPTGSESGSRTMLDQHGTNVFQHTLRTNFNRRGPHQQLDLRPHQTPISPLDTQQALPRSRDAPSPQIYHNAPHMSPAIAAHQQQRQTALLQYLRAKAAALRRTPSSTPMHPSNMRTSSHWLPAGRMRGSLSGRAYYDAINQYLHPRTQSSLNVGPPSSVSAPAYDPFNLSSR